MKDLKLQGVWWVPESPEQTVAGTLVFDGTNHPALELVGTLFQQTGIVQTTAPGTDIVLGLVDGGKMVTLYRCLQVNRSYNTATGLIISRVSASYVFVGAHFELPTDLLFKRFAISYDKLSDWAWLSGFELTLVADPDTGGFKRLELAYEFPDPHEVLVGDVAVRIAPTFNQAGGPIDEYRLTQILYFEARPPEARSFDYYLDFFYHIRNFITLGVGKTVYPEHILATVSVNVAEGSSLENSHTVDIYHLLDSSRVSGKDVHPALMLFSLPKLGEFYPAALNSWFEKASTLKPVYDLYFSTLYNPKMYLEGRFLSLSQALETYHRRVSGGKYLEQQVFETVHSALVEVLDGFEFERDVRNTFVGKLQYINELSLRRRIKELVLSFGDSIGRYIPSASSFAGRVVDTRNYLTHYNQSLEAGAAQGKDLYDLSEQLELLLELCFLRELGLPDVLRTSIVLEYEGYARLVR